MRVSEYIQIIQCFHLVFIQCFHPMRPSHLQLQKQTQIKSSPCSSTSSFCAQNSGKQRKGATSLSASLSIVDAECWENDALVYASSWCSRRCRGSVVGARDADENSVQASFIACHDIERSLSSIMLLAGQRDCLSTTNFLRTWEGGREAQQCLTMLDLFCWDLSALE